MNEANAQLTAEKRLWYGGQWYSGSKKPEILIIGYNPGYAKNEWEGRRYDVEAWCSDYQAPKIKYIEENNTKFSKRMYKLLEVADKNTEKYLENSVAETNLYHYNSPDIETLNKSFNELCNNEEGKLIREEIDKHMHDTLTAVIGCLDPKVLYICGVSTFEEILKHIKSDQPVEWEYLETGSRQYGVGKIMGKPIIVSKHLSWASYNCIDHVNSELIERVK